MKLYQIVASVLFGSLPILSAASGLLAEEPQPTAEQVRFFENRVRPILADHCYECHGPEEQMSGLRLDLRDGILRGGDSGPALTVDQTDQSLILVAIGYQNSDLQMPPDGKLSDRQIADLTRWIEMRAPYPTYPTTNAPMPSLENESIDLELARNFWSFRPADDPPIPSVEDTDWPTSSLDHFVLAHLESQGIRPAPPADKRTLIRRATFDLIGLPPTPEEVEEFLADQSPDAFARVINRLLASPQYGERWGRHWLDVARYADSNGLDENIAHGNAWRYRDYVVEAFNKDKPYDQFLLEQLAGDLLPPTDNTQVRHERLIATGFLSLGPKVLAEVDKAKMEMDIIDEQIDTVGRALMGLTLGCARCHDHKFDPILAADYYALAGIFKSTRTMESFKTIARWNENPIPTDKDLERKAAHEERVAAQEAVIQEIVERANAQLQAACEPGESLPENPESLYPEQTQAELKRVREGLEKLKKDAPVMPTAMGVIEGEVMDVAIHKRGSHLKLGRKVARGFPRVLVRGDQFAIGPEQSGRLELARWLIAKDHPLTSRVMVNRIWRWHFGEGLCRTPDNFGHLGEPPANQPLLDWLAHRFIESGWSIKAMHRLIMLSSTYQMSSAYKPEAAQRDPENRSQWRMNIRRLEAEAIRDSLLAVSGLLDTKKGGSLLHVKNREFFFNHTSEDHTKYDSLRRSLYLPVVRNHLYEVFHLFDYSDASVLNGDRITTTIAPQALFMMNSELVLKASDHLAMQLLERSDLSRDEKIGRLYAKAYGRLPSAEEVARARSYLELYKQALEESQGAEADKFHVRAWASLCHTILAANEFLYVR